MEDSLIDVGPVLFPEEVEAVDQVAGEPSLTDFGPGAVVRRIIEAAYAGGSAGADDLREIEHRISIVRARDKNARDRVPGTLAEAAMPHGVEAVVLVEGNGTDAAHKKVFVGCISQSMPVVSSVTCGALMKLGVGITVHRDAGLNAGDYEGGVVETVFGGKSQFLFCCLRRQFRVGGDGAEVGHDAEDAFGLLGSIGAEGVGVGGCLLGRGARRWLYLARLGILERAGSVGQLGELDGWCEGCRFL